MPEAVQWANHREPAPAHAVRRAWRSQASPTGALRWLSQRGADGPPLHLAVLYGFPPTGDVWEVAGIESGAGTAIIRVLYDETSP